MNRCQWCGKDSSGYGMVVLTIKKDEPSQLICEDCYNKYMSDMLGVEDYKDFEREATFKDCDGIDHCFQIGKKIHPTGVCWEAIEFIEVDRVGYSFEVHQDFREETNDALGRLFKKIENGLSQKYIDNQTFQEQKFVSIRGDIAKGRIEWDDGYGYGTSVPIFIIDGQEYSFEEFGRMMMSYEGLNFRLEFVEPTE